ncbi:MAG TPA: hypothetical protein VHH88_03730, partial [Verrucomicrobiae bacterium]|nr:hypothetical protein [Verrucomicrobiae bacterium]
SIESGQSRDLGSFVSVYRSQFRSATASRRYAFARGQKERLGDLANDAIAVSFLSLPEETQGYAPTFIGPPGLDMGSDAKAGETIVFAWAEDFAPIPSLYKASFKRTHKYTLFRLVLPASAPAALAEAKTGG